MFQAFKVISEAQAMDKKKSLGLFDYYAEVEREIQGLDATFLDLLKTSEGDVLPKIKTRMRRIEDRDYVVLVAGEYLAYNTLPKPLRCFDHDHAKHKESRSNRDREEYQKSTWLGRFPINFTLF